MALSSTPPDPPPSTASAAATTTPVAAVTPTPRLFTNPPPSTRDIRPPTLPLPQAQSHYHHHPSSYPLPTQPQQSLYPAQTLPNHAPRVHPTAIHSQLAAKPLEPPTGVLYPVASSGRGFLPRAVRPQSVDQTVTIANPTGFPPRPAVAAAYSVRPFGFPHSDHQGQAVHLIRPNHLQHTLLGSAGGMTSGTIKGVPVSAHQKVVPSQVSISDCNGYKDARKRSKEDNFAIVRDRKVRILEGSSLYALCRSWLRNGAPEDSQLQYMDGVKSLPKPSPTPLADAHSPVRMAGDKEEEEKEDEGSVEHLSPTELLQRHIKRAKRVRSRLREERLQRIARYKTRLVLLLPPLVEQHQQFRNDMASGN